ncbi:TetR/AcrR family transcriptional regulator [Actinoplanes couchii]|uniref:HTH-type transcriptional regulator PksA n=1 Tax=Actinoplanes couchii TaxID=403638 RepID=A0ABQ3XSQ8_9ACTN|nr:TetR family transcriptional regulator C-terminal domain-containing protein [Actinoplanes couchii]MDR6318562.1 AcrR family transcriptional regulator [Actinoplanes couchii]GID61505.1 HTH-type transcriptional regulator PksA [Actinoplanes couchii]
MPRILDAEERSRLVSEAAWKVLVRDGLPGLSVRRIAAEAGLPPSSLRYTFPTQASVRIRAYEMIVERVLARVAAIPEDDRHWARRALLELVPLDEQRRLEMEAFLALGTAAMTDPTLAGTYRDAHQAIWNLCERVVLARGVSPTDVPLEADRLHAMTDGLALHLVRQDATDGTDWAVQVLDRHLDGLKSTPA